MSEPQKAWNSTPNPRPNKTNTGRLSRSNEPEVPRHCTFVLGNGTLCGAFPSWQVKGGGPKNRRCEKHRNK